MAAAPNDESSPVWLDNSWGPELKCAEDEGGDEPDDAPRSVVTEAKDLEPNDRDRDLVQMYLSEVGAIDFLSHEDEIAIFRRLEIEDEAVQAKRELVRSFQPLVITIAKKYTNRGLEFLDLIQEGNLGLMRAVDEFDYRRGLRFGTCAMWWIRGAISSGLARKGHTICLTPHVQSAINKVAYTRRRMLQEVGRDPTLDELAERLGTKPEKVSRVLSIAQWPVSLDTPIGEDGDLGDIVGDRDFSGDLRGTTEDAIEKTEEEQRRHGAFCKALAVLDTRELRIYRARRCASPKIILDSLAASEGLSRERVRQIELRAAEKVWKEFDRLLRAPAPSVCRESSWTVHRHEYRGPLPPILGCEPSDIILRHHFLAAKANVPSCPECGSSGSRATSIAVPARWRCRDCGRRFTKEPQRHLATTIGANTAADRMRKEARGRLNEVTKPVKIKSASGPPDSQSALEVAA
jgi:RNA polymerase primary sigma factor